MKDQTVTDHTVKDLAKKMHDLVGGNLVTIKMFYIKAESYMTKASKEDVDSIKKAKSLIEETTNLIRDIYTELNKV